MFDIDYYLTHEEVNLMNNNISNIGTFVSEHPEKKVQNLARYLSEDNLKRAFFKLNKRKAIGIDGVTANDYMRDLDANIHNLYERLVHMTYKPLPSRRVYIPKPGSNKKRPLGIPCLEDKIVQHVMAEILNEIYEQMFINESYGFRPKRNCHQAVIYLRNMIVTRKVNYIVDADIKGFFDNIDHEWMIKFLEYRIDDRRFIELINRFLKSGIIENEMYYETDKGTPQGGIISPILANIYLHFVQDLWIEKIVKPKSRGEVYYVRYADDSQICFQYKDDAERYYYSLISRLNKFGLEVAENKTRIIAFGRFTKSDMEKKGIKGKPNTFSFLGFTFYLSQTKFTHKITVKLKTDGKKLSAKMRKASVWLKHIRHHKVKEIICTINRSLRGHYQYYGVSDNYKCLYRFRWHIIRMLFKVLRSRGNRRRLTWDTYLNKILKENPIVNPRIYIKLYSDTAY